MITITNVFDFTGHPVIWYKPEGITSLNITAVGGGGGGADGTGGNAAIVNAIYDNLSFNIFPININVGGGGGYGQGDGKDKNGNAGGGGGMTEVKGLNILIVAGGGGGGDAGDSRPSGGGSGTDASGAGQDGGYECLNNGGKGGNKNGYGNGGGRGLDCFGSYQHGISGEDYNNGIGGRGGDGGGTISTGGGGKGGYNKGGRGGVRYAGGGGGAGYGGGGGGGAFDGGGGGGGSYSNALTKIYSSGPYNYNLNNYGKGGLEEQDGTNGIVIISFEVLPGNPACWEQVGGPQPPRLWSRDEGDCIEPITPQFQQELDMRRKAEILKYKANSAQLTKKQQWSQNVRGAGPNGKKVWANQNVYGSNPNTQKLPRVGNTLILPCVNNNGITCSPSNASDVPGPNIKLCYNPNIPLVNYKVQRTYLAGGTKWPFIGQK